MAKKRSEEEFGQDDVGNREIIIVWLVYSTNSPRGSKWGMITINKQ